MHIDMWYGDDHKNADRIDINFYPEDCSYRGNIYIKNKCVGDYISHDSTELQKEFNQLTFKWE